MDSEQSLKQTSDKKLLTVVKTEETERKVSPVEQLRATGLPEKKIDPLHESDSLTFIFKQESALVGRIIDEMDSTHQRAEVEFIEELEVKGQELDSLKSNVGFKNKSIIRAEETKLKAKKKATEDLSQLSDERMRASIFWNLERANDMCRQELIWAQQETLELTEQFSQAAKEYQALRIENDQWEKFVKVELASALGVSETDEAKWLEAQTDALKEVGRRSFENIRLILSLFTARLHREKGLNQQQIKDLITQEVSRIKDQVFISINMSAESALKFAKRGARLPLTALPIELQRERSVDHNLSGDFEGYIIRRKNVENSLRYGDFPEGSVSCALASPNGESEKRGGAQLFGDVFLILNQEKVGSRTIFTLGDSMNSSWIQGALGTQLIRHPEENVRDRQLIFPHAVIAEGMLNFIRSMTPVGSSFAFVEALVYGGFTLEDVEKVRIPSKKELFRRGRADVYPKKAGKLKNAFNDKFKIIE